MDNGESSYRRYLNGDESAFREIVSEYFDSLVFFIERFVKDYAAAEDIAIDAFTQLVVNKHRYNFRVTLKTYLFMIGRSRALDYIRHRSALPTAELAEAAQIASDAPLLEQALLADERRRAVNAAMEQLGEEQRIAVHLVYFEDLSCEEAARVMKKSRKRIYHLLYQAKNALRAILGEEGKQLL